MMKRECDLVPGALPSSSSSSSSPSSRENVALEESGTIELQGLLERSSTAQCVDDRNRHPASVLPFPDEPRDDEPIKLDQRYAVLCSGAAMIFAFIAMVVALTSVSKSADQVQTSQTMLQTSQAMVGDIAETNQILANDLALLMATMTPASSVPHQVPDGSSSNDSYSVAMIEQLRQQMQAGQADIMALNQQVVDLALLMATMTPASSVPHQVPGDSSSDDSYSVAMIQLRAQMIELNQQVQQLQNEFQNPGEGQESSGGDNENSSAAAVEELYHRVSSLEQQNSDGRNGTYDFWSNFFTVEFDDTNDDENDANLIITAPSVSIRSPEQKMIRQLIEGQNNWVWSTENIDCHVGDTIKWSWSTNENIVEADSDFSPKKQPSFSSGGLNLGGSFSNTFTEPGIYYFMSQNTASLSGTVTVYPGNVGAKGGLFQIPISGSVTAAMPTCTIESLGTFYMRRSMLAVCMETYRGVYFSPPFGEYFGYAWEPLALPMTSAIGEYEYATMDNCPERIYFLETRSREHCETSTQLGQENAIELPAGWSVVDENPPSWNDANELPYFGDWGADYLVTAYGTSTSYTYLTDCSSPPNCGSPTTKYSNINSYSDGVSIKSDTAGKYWVEAGSATVYSSKTFKIVIRRHV